MSGLNWLQVGLEVTWAVFAFAFGSCAGSLINVLVYRLPRGVDVVWTPSRCPACETKLSWRENIPVFGWLRLGGRCRFCRSKISAEYPLVEALVGLLWAGMFVLYYAVPQNTYCLGIDWGAIRPEWAKSDAFGPGWPQETWPIFLVHLVLVASLVAMTLVDAKTFTIPLVIPWFATVVGILFHTSGAAIVQWSWTGHLRSTATGAIWAIPTPDWPSTSHTGGWWWIGASLGSVSGLVLANVLLKFNLIRRSFADYPEWERQALKAQGLDPDAHALHHDSPDPGIPVGEHVGPGVRLVVRFVLVWLACVLFLGLLGPLLGPRLGLAPWAGLAAGAAAGPFLAALACRALSPQEPSPAATTTLPSHDSGPGTQDPSSPIHPPTPANPLPSQPTAPELWIAYPHARREMLKELIFLTPCLALGWLGGIVAQRLWGSAIPPLWLSVLCGTLMGYLIGGGVVWAIRIGGSLAFGKEAMGLGDVHLMAAVGACLGWVNAGLAVPLAAVVGLGFFIISILAARPAGRAMPFGPYLAVATLMVMFGKHLIDMGLTRMLFPGGGGIVNLP